MNSMLLLCLHKYALKKVITCVYLLKKIFKIFVTPWLPKFFFKGRGVTYLFMYLIYALYVCINI